MKSCVLYSLYRAFKKDLQVSGCYLVLCLNLPNLLDAHSAKSASSFNQKFFSIKKSTVAAQISFLCSWCAEVFFRVCILTRRPVRILKIFLRCNSKVTEPYCHSKSVLKHCIPIEYRRPSTVWVYSKSMFIPMMCCI